MNDANEPQTNDRLYTISEAAEVVGVSRSTLLRWELQHQIAPKRVANGQRIYTETDSDTAAFTEERQL